MKEHHVKEQPIQGMMGMGGGATGYLSGGSVALQEYTQTFNYTGSVQDFAIPSGTTQITAYIFGAGGGADVVSCVPSLRFELAPIAAHQSGAERTTEQERVTPTNMHDAVRKSRFPRI